MSISTSAETSEPDAEAEGLFARLCRVLGEFEEAHPIEDYVVHGWQVWPLLRVLFATHYYAVKAPYSVAAVSTPKGVLARTAARLGFYLEPFVAYARWRLGIFFGRPGPMERCDVIICGSGQRYQQLGNVWVHYATGPFADIVEKLRLKCLVWQWGPQPSPASRAAVDTSPVIRARQRLLSLLGKGGARKSPPPWYAAFDDFHLEHVGARLDWSAVEPTIESISHTAGLFETWLGRARPQLIAQDCWTNWHMFALNLAAHRLKIPVVELQHGVQEFGHSSYHGWRRGPQTGWLSMPDVYWVWGERAAALYESNTIPHRVVVGGNPWLARWVSADDHAVRAEISAVREQVAGYARSVLITLGDATAELGFLGQIIRQSPTDWIWLVRSHPGVPVSRSALEEALYAKGHEVRIHEPSEIPLYALLSAADLHVTSYSTCANEALTFGTPTVLFGWQGAELYRSEIDQGVMRFAEDAGAFPAAADAALAADPEMLRQAARPLFMLDEQAMQSALEDVLCVRDNQRG